MSNETIPTTDRPDSILVVGICGSLRQTSYTRMALKIALKGAAESGARTRLIDLREYGLVFCHGGDDATYPPDVFRLREEVGAAQGIILGTPEYHGGVSGVLKNALDLMGFEQFEGKLVGLIGVSGGTMGAVNALNSLRAVGRSLHAWVIPEQVLIPQSSKQFTPDGQAINPALAARLKEVGRQVARFAYLHHSTRAREFLRLWEAAPENPGGE